MGKKRRRKPRGEMGALQLGPAPKYIPLQFPESKDDIESAVLRAALAAAARQGEDPYELVKPPVQNQENDLDFKLITRRGVEYLDLMEAAPLGHFGGSYDKVPQVLNVGEIAGLVYDLIMHKHAKYQGVWAKPPHLLLYATDWRLSLSPSVLTLVAYWLRGRPHGFATIAYFLPVGIVRPLWFSLFPCSDPELEVFDEEQVARRICVRFDQRDVQKTKDGKTMFGVVRVNMTDMKEARLAQTGHMEAGEFGTRTVSNAAHGSPGGDAEISAEG